MAADPDIHVLIADATMATAKAALLGLPDVHEGTAETMLQAAVLQGVSTWPSGGISVLHSSAGFSIETFPPVGNRDLDPEES